MAYFCITYLKEIVCANNSLVPEERKRRERPEIYWASEGKRVIKHKYLKPKAQKSD